MRGTWLASRYPWAVGALGLAVWAATVQQAAPWSHIGTYELRTAAILIVLTALSAFSPIPTRGGGTLTVTLAPLFGAVAVPLAPWAVMSIAAIGTIDSRVPGRQVSWPIFAFNRGMYILAAGLPAFVIRETGLTLWGYAVALLLMLFLNTMLVGELFALRSGASLAATIRAAYAGNGLTYVALPLTGVLIGHLLRAPAFIDQLVVLLLYGPLLIYRASIQKQRRLDTWLRDSYIMQSRVVDKRDGQTFGHSQRVGELSEAVARLLHLSEEACNTIRVGGVLHDLGKIAIPDSILLKPGKLTPEEYEIIKTHPVEGAQILAERWSVQIAPQPEAARVEPVRYREALAVRPFRLLWIGQAVSYFGDTMNTAGLAIMLYVLSHSASVVALGLIAKAAPTILFGLVAGPLVDGLNRQRLMIMADLVRALLTITIPFFGLVWLPGVFIAVFLVATASAFFNPAKQAIIPNLVPSRLLVRANSLTSSSEKTMELLGYSLAGVIAAAVSWIPLFLIDAATYLISAVSLLGVPDTATRTRIKALRLGNDILEGAKFVLANGVLRSTMALTLVATVFFGMTTTILVVMAFETLHAGPTGYGLIEAAIGAGAILGAVIAAELLNRARAGTLLLAGVAGVGLANVLVGFSRSLPLTMLFLLFGGILNMVYYVPVISVTQREAPDYVRGRVMSTRFLLVQAGFLTGMASAGPLSDRFGAPLVFVVGGLFLILAAALGVAFRSLRTATLQDEPSLPPVLKATASG